MPNKIIRCAEFCLHKKAEAKKETKNDEPKQEVNKTEDAPDLGEPVGEAEIDPDGAHMKEKNKDGSVTEIQILESEKPRRLRCTFTRGRIRGSFTAILLGGGDATSLECTMEVEGMGLFAKPRKGLEERLDMLHQALGD